MKPGIRSRFPFSLLQFWLLRMLPMWCGAGVVIFLMQIAVCGVVHDNENVKTLLKFIDVLPSMVKSLIGSDLLQVGNVAGLISFGYQHPLVLILYMLFAVGVPTGFLTGEVQRGTMELILSRPTTKRQVYLCAGGLTLLGMFMLVIVMFLGTVTATNLYDFSEPIPLHLFFRVAVNGGLLAAAVGAVALMAGASFATRGTAVGVTVAFLVVSYFIDTFSSWWPWMEFLSAWTPFYYVDGPQIFAQSSWPLGDMCVLTAITVVAAVAGGIIWDRRDLPL